MKKISMKNDDENSLITEVFERFIKASLVKGVAERTIKTYRTNFKSASRHINVEMMFSNLSNDIINEMIVSMRQSGLAHNTISSYASFFHACPEML